MLRYWYIASSIINNDRYKMYHLCFNTQNQAIFSIVMSIIPFNMIQFVPSLNTLQKVSYKMIQIGTPHHVHILIIINTVLM